VGRYGLRSGAATGFRAIVANNSDAPAVITEIRARLIATRPEPVRGSFVLQPSARRTERRQISFDLDSPSHLEGRMTTPDGVRTTPWLQGSPLILPSKSRITLDFLGATSRGHTQWRIELTTAARQTIVIDDHGQPIASSGYSTKYPESVCRGDLYGSDYRVMPCRDAQIESLPCFADEEGGQPPSGAYDLCRAFAVDPPDWAPCPILIEGYRVLTRGEVDCSVAESVLVTYTETVEGDLTKDGFRDIGLWTCRRLTPHEQYANQAIVDCLDDSGLVEVDESQVRNQIGLSAQKISSDSALKTGEVS
jgi:hypothetical protein